MSGPPEDFKVIIGTRAGPIDITLDPTSSGYADAITDQLADYFGGITLTTEDDAPLSGETGEPIRNEESNELEKAVDAHLESSGVIAEAINAYDADLFYGGVDLATESGAPLGEESGSFLRNESPSRLKQATDASLAEYADTLPVQQFATRQDAIAWAPTHAATEVILIHGYATTGDCPAMRYVKVTDTYLNSLGLSPSSKPRVSFQAASGSWWLLNEKVVYASQVGAFGDAVGADPTTDQYAALQAALDYSSVFSGRVVQLEWRNYLSLQTLNMPPRSTLCGPFGLGRDPKIENGITPIAALHYQPGLVLPSTRTLGYTDACTIENICVRRLGIAQHTTFAEALDFQAGGFVGVGISRASNGDATGCTFRNIRLYGWLVGLDCNKTNGCTVYDIYGDNAVTRVARDAGETCFYDHEKQKPFLTNNPETAVVTITVDSLYDAGGKLGFIADENAVALGLLNGTRIANKKMPSPYDIKRLTVEADPAYTDGKHLFFQGSTWVPEYADYRIVERSQFSFVPNGSYGLVDAPNHIYRVSTGVHTGKIGVRTQGPMPLQVNHWAVFECGGLPQRALCKILQRVSATEFVIDRDWPTVDSPEEAALLALPVWEFELTAQPNVRIIVNPPSWLTSDRGAAFIINQGAGGFVTGAAKGAGYRLENAGAMRFSINVEEGSTGEQETSIPNRTALAIKNGTRLVGYGVFVKSHDTGLSAEFSSKKDNVVIFGGEIVDDGYASIDQTNGQLVLNDIATRGKGRVRVKDIEHLWIRGGEFLLENITSSSTDVEIRKLDLARVHADILAQNTLKSLHNTTEWWGFVNGVLTKFGTLSSSGLVMDVPVMAPNLPTAKFTGTTIGSTGAALTTTGTAVLGTASGYTVDTDETAQWRMLTIEAQRTDGTAMSDMRESAVWSIPVMLQRANNGGSTLIFRPPGEPLTGIAPDICPDSDLASLRINLSNSGANFVVDAITTGIVGSRAIDWVATMQPFGVPARTKLVRRTAAEMLADATPSGQSQSRFALITDGPNGECLAHATDGGAPVLYMRVPPGPYADDTAAQVAGVPSRGFYEDASGVIRRRTT